MDRQVEGAALDQWYVVDAATDVGHEPKRNRLLGRELMLSRDCNNALKVVTGAAGQELPTCERYGYVWTTLGQPARAVVDIPEADESDRQHVPCGERVRAADRGKLPRHGALSLRPHRHPRG